MPAYRSADEAKVRDAVVSRLRDWRPNARIIHEINVCQGGNRIDVLAVGLAEIIAVEVKSERDKLDRLADQMAAMKGVAHHAFAALHEKFFVETTTNAWRSEYERDGQHYYLTAPDGWKYRTDIWRFPEHPKDRWREPETAVQAPAPGAALGMLWHAELHEMCGRYSVSVPKRPTMAVMANALRWQLSGRDLTRGICAALRQRRCIEADPEIEWSQAA